MNNFTNNINYFYLEIIEIVNNTPLLIPIILFILIITTYIEFIK